MNKKVSGKLRLMFVLFAASSSLLLASCGLNREKKRPEPAVTPVVVIPEDETGAFASFSEEHDRAVYGKLTDASGINSDIKGYIEFTSGLISQPVAQSADNERYMHINWRDMSEQTWGTVFFDYRNQIDAEEQNTLIYGHYVSTTRSSDRSLAFTPLETLRDPEQYAANRYFVLATRNDIRYYEVARAFDCELLEKGGQQYLPEDLPYILTSFTEEEFNRYMDNVKKVQYYETGAALTEEDRFVTLQTCIEGKGNERQIYLCRELQRKLIPDEWKTDN